MRKASREMDAAFAFEVLDKAPYVTVSMTRPDGTPYGLPLSLARAVWCYREGPAGFGILSSLNGETDERMLESLR